VGAFPFAPPAASGTAGGALAGTYPSPVLASARLNSLAAMAASALAQPANPAGTASTTLVMMGLAAAYTPASTGRVRVIVTCYATTATATTGITLTPEYGTGAAPVNGAAVTGTEFGYLNTLGAPQVHASGVGQDVCFAFADRLTLTPGTAYWFDLALSTGSALDTATVTNISMEFEEVA
jgi:hypothetical protein